jgi:serine/threonine protein kinase
MEKRIVIGEGSYGCVHKPSIHCETLPSPGFNYDEHVSKIMKTSYAEQELQEFLIIHRIDPSEEYHLGTPIMCKPKKDVQSIKDIKRCKINKLDDYEKEENKYSLLLFKYGGPDIKALCTHYLDKYLSTRKEDKINKLLLEIHHLLKGIQVFRKNDIIHYDIKPQNILLNSKTGKMTFIDFGLTQKREDVLEMNKNNTNSLGTMHWSYPLDTGFLNDREYRGYKNKGINLRNIQKKQVISLLVEDPQQENKYNIPITKPETFQILFKYLSLDDKGLPKEAQYAFVDSFFDGFNELIDKNSQKIAINKMLDSIDVYGLGFSMQYLVNALKRKDYIDIDWYTRLTSFFQKMYSSNPLLRVTDLEQLLDEYEAILLELGILSKVKKHFDNGLLKDGSPPIPTSLSTTDKHVSPELEKLADLDATELSIEVNCPEDKEWNPLKKRCVKKCKEGYTRNSVFKCVKTRQTILGGKTKTKTPKIKTNKKTKNTNKKTRKRKTKYNYIV